MPQGATASFTPHVVGGLISAVDLPWSDRHIAADLEDAQATHAALKAASDATHMFVFTRSRQKDEAENVLVNALVIRNLFEGLADAAIRHAVLVTRMKHYLGSFDDYAKVKPYTPLLESIPRLPGLNFYYAQKDVLFGFGSKREFTWKLHRPHTLIGFAIGNAMNMAVTLAVNASICNRTGRSFLFPGSHEQYNAVADVTDARILAKQLHWATTTKCAQNTPFNSSNGALFRWTWLWPQIAGYFGLEVAEFPGHPGHWERRWPMPLRCGPGWWPSTVCGILRSTRLPRGGTPTPIWAAVWNVSPT